MFTNKSKTVAEYLAALPADQRKLVGAIRALVRKHIPKGYKEAMGFGAITWAVPLAKFPDTYNKQPLCYVAVAAQKTSVSLHLTMTYGDPKKHAWLLDQFKKAGKKADMGKGCLRIKSLDDIPVDAVATLIASHTADAWVALYKKARAQRQKSS